MTTIKSRFPRDVQQPIRFFGYLTVKDLVRVGVPLLVGGVLYGLTGAIIGGLVGTVLFAVKPFGATLDTYLYRAVITGIARFTGAPVAVEAVHDTAVELSDGTVMGVVAVPALDIEMRESAEQKTLQQTVNDLFKAAEFPVRIQSRQRTVPVEAVEGTEEVMVTDHYVTVFAEEESNEGGHLQSIVGTVQSLVAHATGRTDTAELVEQVEERCATVEAALSGGDMQAAHVTGDDLEAFADRFEGDAYGYAATHFTAAHGNDQTYRRTLYISEYPSEVPIAWLADALSVDGTVAATQSVQPLDDAKELTDLVGRLRGELGSMQHSGVARHIPELEAALDDAEWMLDLRSRKEEELVEYGVAITVVGDTPSEAADTLNRVKTELRKKRIDYTDPVLTAPRDATVTGMVRSDAVPHAVIVPGASAASGFPFATQTVTTSGGVVFGRDPLEQVPVVLDRFGWTAPHVARMGATGSGKSYSTKLEILRSIDAYPGITTYIVDPKQEYGDVVEAVDGETVVIDAETGPDAIPDVDVARFTVADRSRDNTAGLTETVRGIYQDTVTRNGKALVVIDESHRLLTDDEGLAVLSTLVREARDTKTAVSLITQNASDFTRSQHGRDILKNVPCTVFMWHDKVNDGVVDFFNLSSEEAVQLRKLRTGTDVDYSEAIVRAAGVLEAKLRITASGQEADIIEHSQQPTPMSDKETQTTVSEYSGDNTASSENESEPGQTQQETAGEESEPSNTGAQDVGVAATSNVETATETQEEAPDEADDWLIDALDVDDYDEISHIDIWRAEDLRGTPLPPTIDGFSIGSTFADVVPAADASARAVYKSPLGDLYRVTYTTVPDDVSPDTILERLRIDLVYSGDDELWGVQIPRDGDTETAVALLQKVSDQTVTGSNLEEVST